MASTMQNVLKTQKRAMRKAVSATLASLPQSSVEEQSQAITAQIISHPLFRNSKTISCYLSMPTGEVETSPLVDVILHQGKTLFVPKIQNKDGIMDFLRIYSKQDLASLPSGTWGIKEPGNTWEGKERATALTSEQDMLDMILLPGVAFDRTLSRLGHGKGYYDRFISTYQTQWKRRPILVGLSLREQVVEDGAIPMGDTDWKLDMLITPDEVKVGEVPELL